MCPEFPGRPETAHWSIPDPAAGLAEGDDQAGYPGFRQTAVELEARVGFLLAALDNPTTTGAIAAP